MFCYAESFDQPIGDWSVDAAETMDRMFLGASPCLFELLRQRCRRFWSYLRFRLLRRCDGVVESTSAPLARHRRDTQVPRCSTRTSAGAWSPRWTTRSTTPLANRRRAASGVGNGTNKTYAWMRLRLRRPRKLGVGVMGLLSFLFLGGWSPCFIS